MKMYTGVSASRNTVRQDVRQESIVFRKGKPQGSEEKRLSNINPWMLPKISDYLDSQTDAVQRFADKVEISPHPVNPAIVPSLKS